MWMGVAKDAGIKAGRRRAESPICHFLLAVCSVGAPRVLFFSPHRSRSPPRGFVSTGLVDTMAAEPTAAAAADAELVSADK